MVLMKNFELQFMQTSFNAGRANSIKKVTRRAQFNSIKKVPFISFLFPQ
jgi:hypothetical protein